eukprot:scaffold7468_cov82-Skeletonema_marinoi.AAC.1
MKADIDEEVRFDADFSEYCIDDDDDMTMMTLTMITLVTPHPRPKTQQPPQVQPNEIHLLPTRLRQDMGKC